MSSDDAEEFVELEVVDDVEPVEPVERPWRGICQSMKKDGKPCSARERYGGYCAIHRKDLICKATKRDGQPCTCGGREEYDGYCSSHRDQRGSIPAMCARATLMSSVTVKITTTSGKIAHLDVIFSALATKGPISIDKVLHRSGSSFYEVTLDDKGV